MGALDDLTKKAKDFVTQNKDEIAAALESEQAEDISDTVLDAVTEKANDVTGGKYADKVDEVRASLDGKIGTE